MTEGRQRAVEEDERRDAVVPRRPRPPIGQPFRGLQIKVLLRSIWRLYERDGTTSLPWGPGYVLLAWTGPDPAAVLNVALPADGTESGTLLTLLARWEEEGEEETTLRLELVRVAGARTDPGPSNNEVVVGRARMRLRTGAGELCSYENGLVHLVRAFPSGFVGGIKMDLEVSDVLLVRK